MQITLGGYGGSWIDQGSSPSSTVIGSSGIYGTGIDKEGRIGCWWRQIVVIGEALQFSENILQTSIITIKLQDSFPFGDNRRPIDGHDGGHHSLGSFPGGMQQCGHVGLYRSGRAVTAAASSHAIYLGRRWSG